MAFWIVLSGLLFIAGAVLIYQAVADVFHEETK